jgi:serine/threonine protein phosphatase 1
LRTFSTKNSKVYHHNGLICVDTFAHGGGCLKAIQVSQMRIYQAYVNGNVQHFDLTKL